MERENFLFLTQTSFPEIYKTQWDAFCFLETINSATLTPTDTFEQVVTRMLCWSWFNTFNIFKCYSLDIVFLDVIYRLWHALVITFVLISAILLLLPFPSATIARHAQKNKTKEDFIPITPPRLIEKKNIGGVVQE